MRTFSLLFIFSTILIGGFMLLTQKNNNDNMQNLSPAEQYLLSLQYPAIGEGIDIYKQAMLKELNKLKKTRSVNTPWRQEGPFNTGGRINTVAIHPTTNTTYLVGCADGGIFKTTDDGVTWTPIFDNIPSLAVSCIVYDKTNPLIIYAGTGDQVLGGFSHVGTGIYKSIDGGATWSNIGLGNVGAVTKIIIDPNNSSILYAGTTGNPFITDVNRGMYKSTNGGTTWTNILHLGGNAGIGDMVIHPTNSSILYATGRRRFRSNTQSTVIGPEARIYKTSDGGATWDTLSTGLPTGNQCRIGLCISANNPNLLYANYVDEFTEFGGIYKTTNGGTSWSLVNTTSAINMGGFGWYFGQIRIDPNNDNTLYLLSIQLYKSTNGGVTFTPDNGFLHADKHDLAFVNSNTMLLGTDGGIYKSTNAANSWTIKNNFPITQFYEAGYNPFDTARYYGGAQDNGTNLGSLSAGASNWDKYFGGDGFRPQFNQNDDQVWYAEWQNGNIVASTDGGNNFMNITQSVTLTDRCSWNTPYLVSTHNPDILYMGSYQVYKNIDGPFDSWFPISGDLTDGTDNTFHVISTIHQSTINDQVIYAGTSDARAWVTQNDGTSWTQIDAGLTNRNVSCILASPDTLSHVFVSQTGYRNNDSLPHLYFSKNYGATWTSIAGNLPSFAINDIWVKPGSKDSSIIIASDGGVYATKDRGVNWDRVGNNMPIIPVFDLEYNAGTKRIMAATFARSMMTMLIDSIFPKPGFPTFVQNINQLIQFISYPNPCNQYFFLSTTNANLQSVTLQNMYGQIVKKYTKLKPLQALDVSDVANGVYILSVTGERGKGSLTINIQH